MALSSPRKGFGRWSRTTISSQVVLATLLAAVGAVLITYLASQPALRLRLDLTAVKANTLDETLSELIEKLPERANVEVFFRPVEAPFTAVAYEAQSRMSEFLFVARNQFPDKLRVEVHDLSDVATVSVRMKELDVREDNVVVVTLGKRKVVLKLLRDIARVDPGNPAMRQDPSLESFRGEDALGTALLRVSIDETPAIVFTTGHGERDLYDSESSAALGRLHSALVADGFRVDRWDSTDAPQIPEGTRVVAIVDARQPLSAGEREQLSGFLERGGRLFVATTSDDRVMGVAGTAEALLERYGIRTAIGRIAQPVPDGFGGWRTGVPDCATIVVSGAGLDARHPITESLWRSESRVGLPGARALAARPDTKPANSVLIDILKSPAASWRDLPDAQGRYDWTPSERLEELGPFAVAMALAFQPPQALPGPAQESASARLVAFTSPDALSNDIVQRNRDFVLNAFNWLAAREHRLVIRPRSTEHRLLDLRNSRALALLNGVAIFGLPGICAALGLFLAWRRRS